LNTRKINLCRKEEAERAEAMGNSCFPGHRKQLRPTQPRALGLDVCGLEVINFKVLAK